MLSKFIHRKDKGSALWVLSGPSGSGKTTLWKKLLRRKSLGLQRSVSCTTRACRAGEKDKEDYFFVSVEKFLEMKNRGEFLEWQKVFGNFYGTSKESVKKILENGKDVLLCIDVKGALEIKKIFGRQAVFIFIIPPDEQALKRRLHIRGRDGKKEMKKRLKFAKIEISYAQNYDYIVVNDQLKKAVKEIESIIITKGLENVLCSDRKISK